MITASIDQKHPRKKRAESTVQGRMEPQGNMGGHFCIPGQEKWWGWPWSAKSEGALRPEQGGEIQAQQGAHEEAEAAPVHAAFPGTGACRDRGLMIAKHNAQDFTALEPLSFFSIRY